MVEPNRKPNHQPKQKPNVQPKQKPKAKPKRKPRGKPVMKQSTIIGVLIGIVYWAFVLLLIDIVIKAVI